MPQKTSSLSIKSNTAILVKLTCMTLFAFWPYPSYSEAYLESEPARLPVIEAKTYKVAVIKKSRSNKVYLFEDLTLADPKVGKIVLLKNEDQPVMAFRVLKTYAEKKQFAAKRLRLYGNRDTLEDGESHLAVEKVSDIIAPPPTSQDRQDLKELEGEPPVLDSFEVEPLAYDPELDAGTSPPPPENETEDRNRRNPDSDSAAEEDGRYGLTAEDVVPFEMTDHAIAGEFNYFTNSGGSYGGGGFRYSMTLRKMIYLHSSQAQDALALEAGGFMYKILLNNSADETIAYNVYPFIADLRYTVSFGESFGTYAYLGFVYNNVAGSDGADDETLKSLMGLRGALGLGLLFQIGPSWDLKINLGMDAIGAGLMLKF